MHENKVNVHEFEEGDFVSVRPFNDDSRQTGLIVDENYDEYNDQYFYVVSLSGGGEAGELVDEDLTLLKAVGV